MSNNKRPPDLGDRQSRLRRAQERLGDGNKFCLICGRSLPIAIELHHIAGQAYSAETIPLCSNHHDDASDWQKDHPAKIEGITSPFENLAHALLGIGDLLKIAATEPQGAALAELLLYSAEKLSVLAHFIVETLQTRVSIESGDVP